MPNLKVLIPVAAGALFATVSIVDVSQAFPAFGPGVANLSASNIEQARVVVRGGAGRVHRPVGGAAVVHGPYRGGAVVRGPVGARAVVGRRYYGGVWYGHVRRYYNGRWWPYGVGACWRSSPIGYVWVCG